MGFIDSFMDICRMETAMLQYVVELLKKDYAKEIALLKIELPNVEKIPYVRFDEAKRLIAEKYDRQIRSPHDLEPEEEALIGEYFKRSTVQISCSLPIIRQRNVRSTRWMIRKTKNLP